MAPLPVQQPLEFWTGGMVPAALRRCGRFADGWLPSACTPEEVAAARVVIDEAAAEAGRAISPEHFGVSIAYAAPAPRRPTMIRALASTRRGVDPSRWSRWASTGCGPCSSASSPWASPSSWSGRSGPPARGGPSSRPWPRASSTSRHDPEPAARARVRGPRRSRAAGPHGRGRGGAGPVGSTCEPVIDEEHEPPAAGAVRLPRAGRPTRSPPSPGCPAGTLPDGTVKPTTVGLQHAAGPQVAWKLRDLGCPLPEGWRITQDHPRRGLVAVVPADADHRAGDRTGCCGRPPPSAPSRPPVGGWPRSTPGCPRVDRWRRAPSPDGSSQATRPQSRAAGSPW